MVPRGPEKPLEGEFVVTEAIRTFESLPDDQKRLLMDGLDGVLRPAVLQAALALAGLQKTLRLWESGLKALVSSLGPDEVIPYEGGKKFPGAQAITAAHWLSVMGQVEKTVGEQFDFRSQVVYAAVCGPNSF